MDMPRRGFIRIIGGGVVTAAAAALGGCDEVPAAANEGWRQAGQQPDLQRRLLSWALLAPNPHNRQPWLVDLSQPDEIVLYCDRERLLPETDPYQRQIIIGHGCFLELLALAAGAAGYRAEITAFPDGQFPPGTVDDRPVARVRLQRAAAGVDPLFDQVLRRRSNKEVYDTARPVSDAALAQLRDAFALPGMRLTLSNDQAAVTALRDLTWRAHETEVRTPRTYMESVRLMRIGRSEIVRHRDGIDIGGPMIELGRLVGAVNAEAIADPTSSAFAQGLEMYRERAMSAMAFGWITSDGNDRIAQLNAGRAYLRVNLKATQLGLAMHPWSQALQEFPEMAELAAELRALVGEPAGQRTQMLFRLGYGPAVEPSPRRPLQSLIRA